MTTTQPADLFVKDPSAILDYKFPWTTEGWLETAETITAHTVSVDAGLTKETSTVNTDGDVIVWLSGGTLGVTYKVTCHVTTSAGRQDDRTMRIAVRDR